MDLHSSRSLTYVPNQNASLFLRESDKFSSSSSSPLQGLRIPLFQLLALFVPSRLLPTTHTAVHTVLLETLRYGGLILTLPRLIGDEWRWPDVWVQWEAFNASAWFGLGWGIGEVAVGIWQGAVPSSSTSFDLRYLPLMYHPR